MVPLHCGVEVPHRLAFQYCGLDLKVVWPAWWVVGVVRVGVVMGLCFCIDVPFKVESILWLKGITDVMKG